VRDRATRDHRSRARLPTERNFKGGKGSSIKKKDPEEGEDNSSYCADKTHREHGVEMKEVGPEVQKGVAGEKTQVKGKEICSQKICLKNKKHWGGKRSLRDITP